MNQKHVIYYSIKHCLPIFLTDIVTSSHVPQINHNLLLKQLHPSLVILPDFCPHKDTHSTGSLVSDSPLSSRVLAPDTSSGPSPSSSPEMVVDHIQESLDSETEPDGIFLNFSAGGSTHSRDSGRQSVAWHTNTHIHTPANSSNMILSHCWHSSQRVFLKKKITENNHYMYCL